MKTTLNLFAALFVLPFLFIMFSCAGEDAGGGNNIPVIRMDVSSAEKEYDITQLMDTSDIKIVPLETNQDCLIAEVSRIFVLNGHIYVFDKQTKGVYIFDMSGKYVNKVHSIGAGPGEYTDISDVFIDENNIFITDYYINRILVYGLDGHFVRDFKTEGFFSNMIFTSGDRLFSVNVSSKSNDGKTYQLFSSDKYGRNVEKYIPYNRDDIYTSVSGLYCYSASAGEVLFLTQTDDIVYRIKNGKVAPAYKLDFGGMHLPYELKSKNPLEMIRGGHMERYVVSTDYVSSTHDLLFLGFHIGVDFYTAIYDKTSGTTTLAGKIFTKIPFNMTLRFIQDGCVVLSYNAFTINQSKAAILDKINDGRVFSGNFSSDLKNAVENINPHDNPVVLICKLKR